MPEVLDMRALGREVSNWGLRENATATAEEIIAGCRDHLAGFQVPRRVEFVEALPKNVTGKVLKRQLREWFS